MIDEFQTVSGETRTEMKVQGSRFIATAVHVPTKLEVEQFLSRMRKEFRDATHNCYAYRLGPDDTQFRVNDDGEPSGSAGRPILAAIDKNKLTDVAVVVTRYFGGTKLGVGGLVRAYGKAAEQSLLNATKTTKLITETVHAVFPHSHIGNVMHVVSKIAAKIVDTSYDEEVHTTLEIRFSQVEELKSALIHHTHGNISFKYSR